MALLSASLEIPHLVLHTLSASFLGHIPHQPTKTVAEMAVKQRHRSRAYEPKDRGHGGGDKPVDAAGDGGLGS